MKNQKIIRQFNEFLEEARRFSPRARLIPKENSTSEVDVSSFRSFVEKAKPLAVKSIRQTLHSNRSHLEAICRWIVPESCDILTVSGLRGDEDPYTNLVAWMLFPKGEPALALRCQRAWLTSIGLSKLAHSIAEPAKPQTQVVTDDGRPDLVLHFLEPKFLLVVEAKIATEEHSTPNNQWQTQSYPSAVRRKLNVSADHPGAMVFLTPDGREAASNEAIVTTYENLVTAISEVLPAQDLNLHVRSAYSHIITHLLTHAASGGSNKADALQKLNLCMADEENLSEEKILDNLGSLGALCRSLNARSKR